MKHDPRSFLFGLPLGIQTTSVLSINHANPDGKTGTNGLITSRKHHYNPTPKGKPPFCREKR